MKLSTKNITHDDCLSKMWELRKVTGLKYGIDFKNRGQSRIKLYVFTGSRNEYLTSSCTKKELYTLLDNKLKNMLSI